MPMLATFPITKTSASRLTPELRDNAPFGAVFSDHMLVADFANGKWGEPRIIPYGAQSLAAAPVVAHYGQGIFEGFKAFPRPNGGAVVFRPRGQSRAHEQDLPAHGDAGDAGLDFHRRHARARAARSRLDSREGQQRPLRPPGDVRHRRVSSACARRRRSASSSRPVRARRISRARWICSRKKPTCARSPAAPARPSAAATTPAACSRRSRRRRRGSTTCCGSTASSGSTSRKPG